MSSRNIQHTKSPISTLSPKILCTIFCFAEEFRGEPLRIRYAFSQVCRSWRTAALANPRFWCDLECVPNNLIPVLLQRSQDADINVVLDDEMPSETIQALAKHLGRIQELVIQTNFKSRIRNLAPSALGIHEGVQALSTQELRLRYLFFAEECHPDDPTPSSPTTLDEDFVTIFSRSPRLEYMAFIDGVSLLWDKPLPPSLTRLEIDQLRRSDLNAFVDTLRRLPQLQGLRVELKGPAVETNTLAPISLTPSRTTHKVDLPYLRTIGIFGIDLATESFFQELNFPANYVELTFRNGPAQPTPVPVLLYLSGRIRHPSLQVNDRDDHLEWPSLRQLHLGVTSFGISPQLRLSPKPTQAAHFTEWKQACREQAAQPQGNVSFSFFWDDDQPDSESYDFPSEVLSPFFVELSRGLPLQRLETLSLDGPVVDSFEPGVFGELLDRLPELVFLQAYALARPLWQALEMKQLERARFEGSGLARGLSHAGSPPLPKLRYVVVSMEVDHHYENEMDEARTAGLDSLQRWLRARLGTTGSKLVRLEFTHRWGQEFQEVIPRFLKLADVVLCTVGRD